MNRLKKAIGVLTILIFVYFVGRYISLLQDPQEKPTTRSSESSKVPSSKAQSDEIDALEQQDLPPPENPLIEADLVLANELLLSFESQNAYEQFIADAEQADISIIARNSSLKALRVRSSNEDDALRIRELAGENTKVDFNHLVAVPSIPQPNLSGAPNQPFKNQALDWLGVPDNNHQWGEGITIVILDTGIDEHLSLANAQIERISLVDLSENLESDYNSHGTAVASLIAGEINPGIAPRAKLIGIQVMDSSGTGDSFTLASGIIEAVDQGASVISMSLGCYGYSAVLENAIIFAQQSGVVMVASAGNDGMGEITYPAKFDGVIAVAAIDTESQRAEFSNFNEAVDIAAPGVGVYAAWGEEDWTSFSGTSAATPFVAGGIAATLSFDSRLTAQEAANIVLSYADDANAPGIDANVGHGTLNMDRVINRDQSGIADVALADFYLDLDQATETTVPLLVTVQNRGTELLRSVSINMTQNEGQSQQVYLGQLIKGETTSHTIYLDRSLLTSEIGYTIQAKARLSRQSDSREANDAKSVQLKILPEER